MLVYKYFFAIRKIIKMITIKNIVATETDRVEIIKEQFQWIRNNKPDMLPDQFSALKSLISQNPENVENYIKLLEQERLIYLKDIQKQLDELNIKLKWQEQHHDLDFNERIKELEKLIETLPDDEKLPYKNLIRAYQDFIKMGIEI